VNQSQLARLIDSTLLKPEATPDQIQALCAEARQYGFASVCVNPSYVSLAAAALADTPVGVGTVVGFPLGANHPAIKQAEARRALLDGASELDMVLAIGRLKAGALDYVHDDIAAVIQAAQRKTVKVILETALLNTQAIEQGCRIALAAGASFVKTSTGFGPGGATPQIVALLRRTVGDRIGIKAAGGIRDAATARALLQAGANRLGTSAATAILAGWEAS